MEARSEIHEISRETTKRARIGANTAQATTYQAKTVLKLKDDDVVLRLTAGITHQKEYSVAVGANDSFATAHWQML